VRELQHLARHRAFDAVDAGDAVANRHDRADLGDVNVERVAADLVPDDLGDFFRFDLHLLTGGLRPAGPPYTLSRAPLRSRVPVKEP
jgi:hypothetical protein